MTSNGVFGEKTNKQPLDRYGHLFPDDLDAVASAFDEAAKTAADRLRTGAVLRPVAADENSI